MDSIGCLTCTVTVDGQGKPSHETGCVTQQLSQHKHVLGKILHALKEAGIAVVELPIEVMAKNSGWGGDS